MPWCDTCDRLVDDDEVVDGTCPRCHEDLGGAERAPLPLRFKLMIGATVLYLIWRLYQLIAWLAH